LVRWGFEVNGSDDTFRNIAAFYDVDSDWALDFDEFVAWVGAAGPQPKARSSWAAGLGCVSRRVDGTRFCNSPPVVYWTLLGMVHTLFSYSVEFGTLLRRPFFLLAVAGLSAVYLSAIHTNLRVQYGGLEQQSEVLETVLEIGLWLGFAHVLGFLHYKDRRLAVWRQRCLQLRNPRPKRRSLWTSLRQLMDASWTCPTLASERRCLRPGRLCRRPSLLCLPRRRGVLSGVAVAALRRLGASGRRGAGGHAGEGHVPPSPPSSRAASELTRAKQRRHEGRLGRRPGVLGRRALQRERQTLSLSLSSYRGSREAAAGTAWRYEGV